MAFGGNGIRLWGTEARKGACNRIATIPTRKDCDDDEIHHFSGHLFHPIREPSRLCLPEGKQGFASQPGDKGFIDRLYALHLEGGFELTEKKIGTILVYGDSDVDRSGVNNAIGTMKDLIRYMKSENIGIVHGTAYRLGDAEKNKKLMKQAYELGLKAK